MNNNTTTLASRVKELRISKGLSQEQLANITQLSLRTIQRIEAGKATPRGDTLRRLCTALGLQMDAVVPVEQVNPGRSEVLLHLSALGYIAFPLLGALVPYVVWRANSDRIEPATARRVINFQLWWNLALLTALIFSFVVKFNHLPLAGASYNVIAVLYLTNFAAIVYNAFKAWKMPNTVPAAA